MLLSEAVLDRPVSGGAGWAVVQLVDTAALVPVATIERDLLRHVPAAQIFFPAITTEGLPSPLHPLSAYAFPRADLADLQLLTLERSRYVEAVLRAGRGLAKITDADLLKSLRAKLRADTLLVGQPVLILAGDWAGIEGKVAQVRGGLVTVYVELRSTRTLVRVAPHELQVL